MRDARGEVQHTASSGRSAAGSGWRRRRRGRQRTSCSLCRRARRPGRRQRDLPAIRSGTGAVKGRQGSRRGATRVCERAPASHRAHARRGRLAGVVRSLRLVCADVDLRLRAPQGRADEQEGAEHVEGMGERPGIAEAQESAPGFVKEAGSAFVFPAGLCSRLLFPCQLAAYLLIVLIIHCHCVSRASTILLEVDRPLRSLPPTAAHERRCGRGDAGSGPGRRPRRCCTFSGTRRRDGGPQRQWRRSAYRWRRALLLPRQHWWRAGTVRAERQVG